MILLLDHISYSILQSEIQRMLGILKAEHLLIIVQKTEVNTIVICTIQESILLIYSVIKGHVSCGFWSSIIKGGWTFWSKLGLWRICIWGFLRNLVWAWGLIAVFWEVLGCVSILEILLEMFLSKDVISWIFWSSSLD